MRRVPAGGEEGIGVHGENRRAPARGAGGSVEAPTVPGVRGQSLERRPPPPSPPAPASPSTPASHPPRCPPLPCCGPSGKSREASHPPRWSHFIPHHRALLPRELPTFRPQGTVDRGRGRPLRAAAGGPSDRTQREDRPLRTGLLQGKGRMGRRGRRAAGRTAEFSSGASEGSSAVRDPNAGGKMWGRTRWPCGRRRLPGTAMSSIPKPLRIHPETESGRGNDRRQTARED